MTPQEYNKAIVTISKDTLATLPAAEYEAKVILVDKPEMVDSAIEELRKSPVIGFDTETRPCFRKGQQFKVALVQLSTKDTCYLFRTNLIGFPEALVRLLEDPDKLKVGLSIHDDFHNIRKSTEIEPEGFLDLQNYVKDFKIADISLSRVYGILFGKRISKGQRLTNWEAPQLTEPQQHYAALDALACISIYEFLKEGKFDPRKSEYLTIPPDPITEDKNEN